MPHQQSWPLVGPSTIPGPSITTAQYLLRAHGSAIAADGIYGPQTKGAIEKFQANKGLLIDGKIGDQTWPVLIITVDKGDKGDAVRAAQLQLSLRGLPETQGLDIDGDFGPLTEAATKAFQKLASPDAGPVDGIVGPLTWFWLMTGFAVADV